MRQVRTIFLFSSRPSSKRRGWHIIMSVACLLHRSRKAFAFHHPASKLTCVHLTRTIVSHLAPFRSLGSSVRTARGCPSPIKAFIDGEISLPPSTRQKVANQSKFEVTAPHTPTGDQPQAISRLVNQVSRGDKFSILRGCTGTGKTLVMAHTIARIGRPTLVLCHNKTLAAQLARELRSCFKKNHVQLFVSYYNYYFPESYSEATGKYRAKKSSINDDLDALRHLATRSLVQHSDVVIVASVSCIYGLGMPKSYLNASFEWKIGDSFESINDISSMLKSSLYVDPNEEDPNGGFGKDLNRGEYELSRIDDKISLSIWQPSDSYPLQIYFESSKNNGSYKISAIVQGHAAGTTSMNSATIFPARHHVTNSKEQFEEALRRIEDELANRIQEFQSESKTMEAERLSKRVNQDLMLLRETGSCPGVENYSRQFESREEGEAPDTLLEYFGYRNNDDWLLLVDESHVTLPQLKAMYSGDRARKLRLVKHGYRLPSALDNRPLRVDEFWDRVPQTIFVSATPSREEFERIGNINNNNPVDMIIRPTYVCDPIIRVKPTQNQLDDLLKEVQSRSQKNERTLAMALTKRDAEDLANYLRDHGVSSTYIHSGLNTLERSNALKALQSGEVDCLVGVNLLREGLDLPQVSLVAILNADAEGFLRSESCLLQTIGRSARNKNGEAIFYANRITKSMKLCMDQTRQRRKLQLEYNSRYGKEMKSTNGSSVLSIFDLLKDEIAAEQTLYSDPKSELDEDATVASGIALESDSIKTWNLRNPRGDVMTDHIPSKPGVYLWKDKNGDILYIGKAKRLRSRVKSYLAPNAKHSSRIKTMVKKATAVEFVLTPSDRDALILESNLIKHHQPPYNILLKDDGSSYPYICASLGDTLPQLTIVPHRFSLAETASLTNKYKYFGPYPHYSEINKLLLDIEEKYDLRSACFKAKFGTITKSEYRSLFQKMMGEVFEPLDTASDVSVEGTSNFSILKLRSQYEEASELFQSKYNQNRDVVAISRNDDESPYVVHVMQLRNGLIAGQFSYSCELDPSVEEKKEEDYADIIETVLKQRHYPSGESSAKNYFSFFPEEVLLQYPVQNAMELKQSIRSSRNAAESKRVKITAKTVIRNSASRGPRRESDKRAMRCAVENAQQVAYERSLTNTKRPVLKSSVDGTAMKELVSMLSLKKEPKRIEAYDISHTQGESVSGSMVVFLDGKPAPHLTRRFNIKAQGHEQNDDYASIEEIIERRFKRVWVNGVGGLVDSSDPWSMPDLVVIDGGRGQLGAAIKGMAKANIFPEYRLYDDEEGRSGQGNSVSNKSAAPPLAVCNRHASLPQESKAAQPRSAAVKVIALAKKNEHVFVAERDKPVNDSADSPGLLLLRALRDESHRIALGSHKRRRSRKNGL